MRDFNQLKLPFFKSSLWNNFLKKHKMYYQSSLFVLLITTWLLFVDGTLLNNALPYYKELRSITGGYSPSFTNKEPIHDVSLPAGLSNLRNTCYLNSILQSLFALKSFRNLLLVENMFAFEKDSFGEELQKLFVKMAEVSKGSSGGMFSRSVTPLALAKKLNLDISTQEDAQELLLRVLDVLDESLLASEKTSKPLPKKKKNQNMRIEPEDALLPSAAMKMFIQQNITCIEHNHIASSKILKHYDLTVHVKGMGTLENAIANAFQPELLDDKNNLYKCDIHGYIKTNKTLSLMNFPRIFTVHLNRFSFDPLTFTFKKINDPLDIPLTLDLRKYCTNSDVARTGAEGGRYALTALVIHQGSIEQGHYFTLAKLDSTNDNANGQCEGQDQPGQWVQCNDHQVSRMSEQAVLKLAKGEYVTNKKANTFYEKYFGADAVSTNAYILFYTEIEQ